MLDLSDETTPNDTTKLSVVGEIQKEVEKEAEGNSEIFLTTRQQMILAMVQRPTDLYTMAKQLQVHEMTVRRDVHELVDLKLVKEYPLKNGKRKQYVRSEFNMSIEFDEFNNPVVSNKPEVKFSWQGQTVDLTEIISAFILTEKPELMLKRVSGALAHLIGRSFYLSEGMADRVSAPNGEEALVFIKEAYDYFKSITTLLNSVLLSPIFDDEFPILQWTEFEGPIRAVDSLFTRVWNQAMQESEYRDTLNQQFKGSND